MTEAEINDWIYGFTRRELMFGMYIHRLNVEANDDLHPGYQFAEKGFYPLTVAQ